MGTRAAGLPVGLATNATDLLRGNLEALGLADEFDVVLSSWELKIHKPAPEFFQRACQVIRVLPKFVLFVDDDQTEACQRREHRRSARGSSICSRPNAG